MAFTPEQIAKAYMGAQGDIYDVYAKQQEQEALRDKMLYEQRKNQVAEERKQRQEQNNALSDFNRLQSNLAIATNLPSIDNPLTKEISDWGTNLLTGDNKQLFKEHPNEWNYLAQESYGNLFRKAKNFQEGAKKTFSQVEDLNKQYNGSLDATKLANAIANISGYNQGKLADVYAFDEATGPALLNGLVDLDGTPLVDKDGTPLNPKRSAEITNMFIDPIKDEENVLTGLKKLKRDKEETTFTANGIPQVIKPADIYPWQKVVKGDKGDWEVIPNKSEVLEVEGKKIPVYSKETIDIFTKSPNTLRSVLRYENNVLEHDDDFLAATSKMTPEQKDAYATTLFIDKKAPKDFALHPEYVPDSWKTRQQLNKKEKEEDKPKDSLHLITSLHGMPIPNIEEYPTADPRFYSAKSVPAGTKLEDFHEYTDKSSKELLKDASNISFKIWRNAANGKDYFTIEETKGTNSVQTALSKEAARKGWQKGVFYPIDKRSFYLNFPANSFNSNSTKVEEEVNKGKGGTTSTTTSSKPAPTSSVQAAATTAPATTSSGNTNWSAIYKKRKEEQEKKNKKK